MEYQIATLSIVAILNVIFSYFIVKGDNKTPNTFFALVTLSVSLWALNLSFFIKSVNLDNALIFANLYYLSAAATPVLFFCFSLVFLNKNTYFKKKYYLTFIPFILLTFTLLSNKNTIIKEVFVSGLNKNVILNTTNYLLYSAYILFFVIMSYIVLVAKYKKTTNKTQEAQLKLVIFGTSISYIIGMIFNLFLPWFGVYNLIWLGPPFTLIMVSSIGYAIIKHRLFDIKIITTQALTFLLIFFILIRTIIADTLQEQIINGILLFTVSVVGILLIRSVIEEVKTREKIEKLAEDLKIANIQLKKLDKQKSEFVSIASHQLRAPIASLKGYSSMIMEGSYGPVSAKVMEVVSRLFQSSQSLSVIVDDFLNLSRIERGKIDFTFSKNNLREIVEQAINEIKPIAKAKKIEIIKEIKEKNYIANMDSEKIKQVISNLLDNSLKYTPKGSISIKLSKTNDGKTLLMVRDTGIGLPKNKMHQLFHKFKRLHNANDANIKGTGLGLFLAKTIIDAHGGKIWAESEGEGRGSTFFVELKGV